MHISVQLLQSEQWQLLEQCKTFRTGTQRNKSLFMYSGKIVNKTKTKQIYVYFCAVTNGAEKLLNQESVSNSMLIRHGDDLGMLVTFTSFMIPQLHNITLSF